MTLRAQLTLAFLSVAAATGATLAYSYLRLHDQSLARAQERQLTQTIEEVRRVRDEAEFAQDPLMMVDALRSMLRTRPELAWFKIERQGLMTPVERTKAAAEAVELRLVEASGRKDAARIQVAFSRPYLDGQRREAAASALANMRSSLGVAFPVIVVLALLLGGRLSRRIRVLSETVERIGQGKLGATAAVSGRDEVGRLATQINDMSRRLGELEETKRTFVASVTHELRSPLASIESCVRLLLSEEPARSQAEADMLRRIQANASRLGHFVTNLLELARIERGKLELHARPTDVRRLLEDAVLFFEPRAREAGLELKLQANGDLPEAARLDPDLLTQVLANLVSNAIKFTPKGGRIEVDGHRRRANAKDWFDCWVQDTGTGIPSEAQAKLFVPFERVKNAMGAPGTGLGLAVCKSIVELHGGTIGIDSVPGKGSRFHFSIPLA